MYSDSVSLYGDLGIGILTEYHKCFWSQVKSVFYQHFISKRLFVIEGWKSSQCLDYNLKTQRKSHMFQNNQSIFISNPALLWLWEHTGNVTGRTGTVLLRKTHRSCHLRGWRWRWSEPFSKDQRSALHGTRQWLLGPSKFNGSQVKVMFFLAFGFLTNC